MGLQLRKQSRRSFASHVLMLAAVSFLALPSCAGSRRPPKEPACPPDAAIGPDGSCWVQSDFGPDEDDIGNTAE